MCQGFTQNLGGLATCRALMGVFESGFVPGMNREPDSEGAPIADSC